jgi:hypothetical protein
MRFSIPEARLESRSAVTGTFLTSLSRVSDSIRAHGGTGAAVDLVLELDITLERFEPVWPGAPAPRPWAHGAAQIEVPTYGGIGVTTVGSGKPGQQVDQRTLRMTRPIVPEGEPLAIEWFVESGAGGGGTSSATGHWRVSTNDPSVTLEHCRDLLVPARAMSWGRGEVDLPRSFGPVSFEVLLTHSADGRVIEPMPGTRFHIPAEPHDSRVVGDAPYVSLPFLGANDYAR